MSDLKYSVFNLFILLHFEDLPSDGNAQFFFILDTFALSIMRIIFFWPSKKGLALQLFYRKRERERQRKKDKNDFLKYTVPLHQLFVVACTRTSRAINEKRLIPLTNNNIFSRVLYENEIFSQQREQHAITCCLLKGQ